MATLNQLTMFFPREAGVFDILLESYMVLSLYFFFKQWQS
jgi:hypothetical protein